MIEADKGSNVIPGRQQSISKASACYLFSFPSRGIPGGFLSLTSVLQNVIIIVTVWVAVSREASPSHLCLKPINGSRLSGIFAVLL